MEVGDLVLAAEGALDMCLKFGKDLVNLCRDQHKSDLEEIHLTFEGVWIKTETQLQAVKTLLATLPPELPAHYSDALSRLQLTIAGASKSYERVTAFAKAEDRFQDRGVRAVYLRRHLQQIVLDLEEWQKRFDPSWYLIARVANPMVDQRLGSLPVRDPSLRRLKMMRKAIQAYDSGHEEGQPSVFKDPGIIADSRSRISESNTYLSTYRHDSRPVLLDRASAVGGDARKNVGELARLFSNVEPDTFGLLKCSGVVGLREEGKTQLHYVFEIPERLSWPKTLRCLLREGSGCSISQRFQIAKDLARSVMFLHATGFVHKNIRPESVIVFECNAGPIDSSSFLIDFEIIHKEMYSQKRLGDLEWQRNLYRHPLRQGLLAEYALPMQQDIYSLGVCLLEVGLWTSFVRMEGDVLTLWAELGTSNDLAHCDQNRGYVVRDRLVQLAHEQLPSLVGDRYTNIVTACLGGFGLVEGDNTGAVLLEHVGVEYIEKILSKIEELCV